MFGPSIITWWIENTTPVEFRDAIKEGVLAWNKAFEKAGFNNALEVKYNQMMQIGMLVIFDTMFYVGHHHQTLLLVVTAQAL